MNIDWSRSGYPPLHYVRMRESLQHALIVALFTIMLFVLVFVATILGYTPSMIPAAITAAFVVVAVIGSSVALYVNHNYVQVIPYFQRSLGDIDTFLVGHTMARFLNQLDAIASQLHVRPISSYGFNDDILGEELVWHDPADGLATVSALTAYLPNETVPNDLKINLQHDLDLWRIALEKAAATNIRFCVLLRHGNSTSGHEWDVREGSAF